MSAFVELTDTERDAVLAGLRLLQLFREEALALDAERAAHIDAIEWDSGEALDDDELEALIEEINAA